MSTIKMKLKKEGVYFFTSLPSFSQVIKVFQKKRDSKSKIKVLIICDRKAYFLKGMKAWFKNHPVYLVSAGEKLKDLEHFPNHVNQILKKIKDKNISGVVSIGGGSTGDFAGFFASVYKRGVPLIHVPTTWLAAIDSAHGGKTALNVKGIKNQIGSYFFPEACFIIKDLLSALPKKQVRSARGELIKIALIEGGSFYKKLLKKNSEKFLWQFLPEACLAKLKIVKRDPYEKKGNRHLLNLGHTLAHILESFFGLSHGEAVLYGIAFSAQWSLELGYLSSQDLKEILELLELPRPLSFYLKKLSKKSSQLNQLLLRDKKCSNSIEIQELFIHRAGGVFSEKVLIKNLLKKLTKTP